MIGTVTPVDVDQCGKCWFCQYWSVIMILFIDTAAAAAAADLILSEECDTSFLAVSATSGWVLIVTQQFLKIWKIPSLEY